MEKFLQLSVIVSIFLITNAMPSDRPNYVNCLDSSECGKGSCCTIGMGRYSVPSCRKTLELGASCRPDHIPQKYLDLSYPDNSTVHMTNVYYNLCPCMASLICNRTTRKCEDPSIHVSFNYIDYY